MEWSVDFWGVEHKMLVISNISKIRVSETPTLILFNIVIYKDLRSTATVLYLVLQMFLSVGQGNGEGLPA